MNKTNETFNGHANYETWNVSLWIENDEGLYNMARRCHGNYKRFTLELAELGGEIGKQTPDGVAWNDSSLDIEELNEMMNDL